MHLPANIEEILQRLEAINRLRSMPKIPAGLIDFSSNDYLGLARLQGESPQMMAGATGSRLLTGTHEEHLALEGLCAEYFRGEAALLYGSGYLANLGLLSCIGGRGDTFLYDEAVHASVKDGMRLSVANRLSFRHNDLEDLQRLLAKTSGNRFILAESLYSMDGDLCDIRRLCDLAKTHGAWIILDEAHSTGIYGKDGSGWAAANEAESGVFARVFTFGKAAGLMGAVVVGPQILKEYLINRSRTWIYSTAMPPGLASSVATSIELMRGMGNERKKLVALRNRLNARLDAVGLKGPITSNSPICPLLVPGNENAKRMAEQLRMLGFDLRAILSPTVAEGTERLRISLHSFNKEDEIDTLVEAIAGLT